MLLRSLVLLFVGLCFNASTGTAAEKATPGARVVKFFGYDDCIELTNKTTRVVLCPAAGGRVLVYALDGKNSLFLDESAHDWKHIRLGRELGWTGVALKTCKTQTGALLSACWAKGHGMTLMVQDLTNPMLAQVPHCRLAAQVGTIMGVETNAMQFYPEASAAEAKVHPGLHRRRDGCVDLSTLGKVGFGYRLGEVESELPPAEASFGG